jgi:Galactose oxidase, central domain/Kelch motif/HYR domain
MGNLQSITSLRERRGYHTATALRDGRVVVVGGWDGTTYLNTVELYDPTGVGATESARGISQPAASMPVGRGHHTALLLASDKVLVIGGITGGSAGSSSLEGSQLALLYDASTNAWQAVKPPNRVQSGFAALADARGRAMVIGGIATSGEWVTTAQTYDPSTDSWTETGPMVQPRANSSATLLDDGRVLVTGGTGTDPASPANLGTAEIYDPTTNTWAATGSMTLGREYHVAVRLDDGRVLVVGGRPNKGGGWYSATAELYDPANGIWTATGSMSQAKIEFTTTLLLGGRVLVTGGRNAQVGGGGVDLDIGEIYNAKTGVWTAAPEKMSTPLAAHTATWLRTWTRDGGGVLLLGGIQRKSSGIDVQDYAASWFLTTGASLEIFASGYYKSVQANQAIGMPYGATLTFSAGIVEPGSTGRTIGVTFNPPSVSSLTSSTTVSFTAQDVAGAIEGTFAIVVQKLDTTKPTLTWITYDSVRYLAGSRIEVDAAASAAGALVPFVIDAVDTDNPSSELTITCTPPPSGAPFPVGDTVVTCTISDPAGNTETASFTIRVNGIPQQIVRLRDRVGLLYGYPSMNDPSLVDGLIRNLDDVLLAYTRGDLNAACSAMDVYMSNADTAVIRPIAGFLGRNDPAAQAIRSALYSQRADASITP